MKCSRVEAAAEESLAPNFITHKLFDCSVKQSNCVIDRFSWAFLDFFCCAGKASLDSRHLIEKGM